MKLGHNCLGDLSVAILLGLGMLVGVSCRQAERPAPAKPPEGLAQVGGKVISRDEFAAALKRRHPQLNEEPSLAQKMAVMEELLREESIYAKATAAGFDRSAELQAKWKRLIVAEYREQQFQAPAVTVSEAEIENHYAANHQRYSRPEEVHGAVIFLQAPAHATAEKKQQFRQRADAILAEARRGESEFSQLAQRHSDDQATRYRGGDVGWMTRLGPWEPELRQALFTLDRAGQVAPLVPTPRGFYIAKLLERKPASTVPLAEVRQTIRYQLEREKARAAEVAFYESMKAGLEIRIDQKQVEMFQAGVVRQQPPRLPGAQTAKVTSNP